MTGRAIFLRPERIGPVFFRLDGSEADHEIAWPPVSGGDAQIKIV